MATWDAGWSPGPGEGRLCLEQAGLAATHICDDIFAICQEIHVILAVIPPPPVKKLPVRQSTRRHLHDQGTIMIHVTSGHVGR